MVCLMETESSFRRMQIYKYIQCVWFFKNKEFIQQLNLYLNYFWKTTEPTQQKKAQKNLCLVTFKKYLSNGDHQKVVLLAFLH